MNKISKDIIVRSKSMSGFTPYIPGWDTWSGQSAGIGKNKIKRKEMDLVEYLNFCVSTLFSS